MNNNKAHFTWAIFVFTLLQMSYLATNSSQDTMYLNLIHLHSPAGSKSNWMGCIWLTRRSMHTIYLFSFLFCYPQNAAIDNTTTPHAWTTHNITQMKKQMNSIGVAFDWEREIDTHDESYYKWTQWIFILLYKKGLVYRKEGNVNWDPLEKTVLANEQVVNGRGDRYFTSF